MEKMAAPVGPAEPQASGGPRTSVCLLVLGMAGSGKTTFVQVTSTVQSSQDAREVACGCQKARVNGREVSEDLEGGFLGDLPSAPLRRSRKPGTPAWVI